MFKVTKELVKKTDINTAQFLLTESKDYLDYTLAESNKITQRAFSYLIIFLSVLSADIGYTFTVLINSTNKLIYYNFCFLVILSIFIRLSILILKTRGIYQKGNQPQKLYNNYLSKDLKKDESLLIVVLNEINQVEHKVTGNLSINEKRRSKLDFITIWCPSVLVLFFIISMFFIYS